MSIGDNIRAARIECNMTQAELAEKVGLSQSTIALYEAGKRELTASPPPPPRRARRPRPPPGAAPPPEPPSSQFSLLDAKEREVWERILQAYLAARP